jgi:hypothetical protein
LSKPVTALRVPVVHNAKKVSFHPDASVSLEWAMTFSAKRAKHWDKAYVSSLEDQIRLNSTNVEDQSGTDEGLPASSPRLGAVQYSGGAKRALEQLSTARWMFQTSSGGQEALFSGPGKFSILSNKMLPVFELEQATAPSKLTPADATAFVEGVKLNLDLKKALKERFLSCINPYYNFVDPSWLQFSDMFPDNDAALQLLYSAMFAASAYSSPEVSRSVARGFLAFAEGQIQHCYLEHLCLSVLQALLILAWLKLSMLDSRRGDLYKRAFPEIFCLTYCGVA